MPKVKLTNFCKETRTTADWDFMEGCKLPMESGDELHSFRGLIFGSGESIRIDFLK